MENITIVSEITKYTVLKLESDLLKKESVMENKKIVVTCLLLILILFMSCNFLFFNKAGSISGLDVSQFEVFDSSNKPIKINDYNGNVLVLNFWRWG